MRGIIYKMAVSTVTAAAELEITTPQNLRKTLCGSYIRSYEWRH